MVCIFFCRGGCLHRERAVCACICGLLGLLGSRSKAQPRGQALPWSSSGQWQNWGLARASWGLSCYSLCLGAGILGIGISLFGKALPAASALGKK